MAPSIEIPDYTEDDICRALGLGGLVDDSLRRAAAPALRVLLMPSFHPEVCVSVLPAEDGGGESILDVRTFDGSMWSSRHGGRAPAVIAVTAPFPSTVREALAAQLGRCPQPASDDDDIMILDGMPLVAVRCQNARADAIRDNGGSSSPRFHTFLRTFLRRVRRDLPSGPCRTAVAHAKKYLHG